MVLAQKQTHINRSIEQNREPGTLIIYDKGGNNIQWRKQSLQ